VSRRSTSSAASRGAFASSRDALRAGIRGYNAGDKSGAVFFYRTTLKYDANHRGALNNLGRIALDDSRFDLAESCLRRAEQLDHRDAKTHYLLAKALLGKGNRDAASSEIDAAMQLRPGQAEFTQLKDKISSEIP